MPIKSLNEHFASYFELGFRPNASASATSEFQRLCKQFGWDKKRKKEEQRKLSRAMVDQFKTTFGTSERSLQSWQALCSAIDMESIPATLTDCRNAVAGAHVNLVDLLSAAMHGKKARRFRSEEALSKYTKRTKKFFPLGVAKSGGLLRFLLRSIRNPPPEAKTTRKRGSKRVRSTSSQPAAFKECATSEDQSHTA